MCNKALLTYLNIILFKDAYFNEFKNCKKTAEYMQNNNYKIKEN